MKANIFNQKKERKCQECGEPLRGRADQKFCCDACRNAFNNKKLSHSTHYIRKINRILKHNHLILEKLNPGNNPLTSKISLLDQGFDFNHFTHLFKSDSGQVYYYCYDQGFSILDSINIRLVKEKQQF